MEPSTCPSWCQHHGEAGLKHHFNVNARALAVESAILQTIREATLQLLVSSVKTRRRNPSQHSYLRRKLIFAASTCFYFQKVERKKVTDVIQRINPITLQSYSNYVSFLTQTGALALGACYPIIHNLYIIQWKEYFLKRANI